MTTLVLNANSITEEQVDIKKDDNQPEETNKTEEPTDHNQKPDEHSVMHIPILIYGLGDEPFTAKVDTGAQCCSLGATDIKNDDEMVEFTINDRRYRTACTGMVSIQTADGTEQRPTIEVSCKVKGTLLRDIKFNLNDRSNMPDQILIGMNLLNHLDLDINTHEEADHSDR